MADAAKARWTRLASLGLLLAGLGPLLLLVGVVTFGLDAGEDLVFFLVTVAIGLVGAFLVWQFGTWSKFVGILAGLLLGLALFWTAFGLEHPASFFDFVPGVLVLPGALLGIGASIAAIVAKRRGHLSPRPEGGERRGIQIVLGIVLLAAVVSGALNLFYRPTASPAGAQASIAINDFEFGEGQLQVGGGTQLFVDNEDPFYHSFTVDELGIDEGFIGGSSKVIDIPQEPGTYVLYCRPHTMNPEDPGEEDMAATLTVT